MSQVIEVFVAPNGAVRVTTEGFVGSTCRQASEFLESALGQRTSEQLTSAFYQTATHQQSTHVRGQ